MTKKTTALVLHGFPGLSINDPIRKYLERGNFDAVIPDLFTADCDFNIECLSVYLDGLLNGRESDVIIAASLGGLIAPHIALKYPNAKLILIATGPRINIGIPIYNFLIKKGGLKMLSSLTGIAQKVPTGVYRTFYKVFNPYKNISGPYDQYQRNMTETFINFKNFPKSKAADVINFVKNTDNTEVLKLVHNRTLIISGGYDVMMPNILSNEMKELIKNSVLIENTERLHYQVFDERDFRKLDYFLR